MKIVQTSHHYYPHTGGTERVVKILVDGLVSKGNEVHIFSDAQDIKQLGNQKNTIYHAISLRHVGKFRFPQRDYGKQIENVHSDIVHVQGQRVWSSDYLYRKLKNIHARRVFTAHGFYQMIFGGKANNVYYQRFMPSFLSKFDRITSLTDYEANLTRTIAPKLSDRIIVIPDPVDMDLIDSCINAQDIELPNDLQPQEFILHSGGLQRNKNIEHILSAMEGKKMSLVLTGNLPDPAYWNELQSLASQKNVHIIHLGNVNDHTLYNLMKNCSHYVSPSKFESFGMSMVEASYTGASVIAYNTGVAQELSDLGVLEIAKNPQDIGKAFESFKRSDDPAKTREQLRMRYDRLKVVDRYSELYEELIDE